MIYWYAIYILNTKEAFHVLCVMAEEGGPSRSETSHFHPCGPKAQVEDFRLLQVSLIPAPAFEVNFFSVQWGGCKESLPFAFSFSGKEANIQKAVPVFTQRLLVFFCRANVLANAVKQSERGFVFSMRTKHAYLSLCSEHSYGVEGSASE